MTNREPKVLRKQAKRRSSTENGDVFDIYNHRKQHSNHSKILKSNILFLVWVVGTLGKHLVEMINLYHYDKLQTSL